MNTSSPVTEPSITTVSVMGDDGSLDPQLDPKMSDEQVLQVYRAMVRTRRIDERLVTLQRQGRIGFHIGSLGEEATILGSAFAMRQQDYLFPAYREFGAALWRGMPLQAYINNMFGNSQDPAKGRQMPDHYTCRAAHFGSVSSPIGTQMTHAVGFSMAARMRGEDLVALAYFGEGATSSIEFHNAMNFAGVFRSPTILFCRNNHWAISVPSSKQSATETFAEKGRAYGVNYVRCDGNDVFAVVRCTQDAVHRAAQGQGPTLIEALTYRLSGHSTSDDPTIYRADDDVEHWRRRDPIERLLSYLRARQLWTDQNEDEWAKSVDAEVKAAIETAEALPVPSLESMFDDVYADLTWNLVEQRQQLLSGPRAPGHH